MPSAVVEIQYVNRPQPGKKMGSVKDAEGNYYGVSPGMLGMFQQGGVYEILYEDRDYQGKTYHTVKTVKAHESKTAPAAAKVLSDVQRARTAREDEIQINKRHRLTWIGERLDASKGQLPITYEALRPAAGVWGLIYDELAAESDEELPEKANGPTSPKAKQPLNEEMGDDIPY